MKILFLTNNIDVTLPLLEWLRKTEGEKNVILWSDALAVTHFSVGEALFEVDFIISYNYAYIIGQEIISLFPHRIINLHISLLPWNRGAAPNIWSFIDQTPSGVTIHEIDEGVDTGDILLQCEIIFDYQKETLKTSYEKSHVLIQRLFCENWQALKKGEIVPKKQHGPSTCHRSADLRQYKDIIDYNDTIAEFLQKAFP